MNTVQRAPALPDLAERLAPMLRQLEGRRRRLIANVLGCGAVGAALPATGFWILGDEVAAAWLVGGGALVAGLVMAGAYVSAMPRWTRDYKDLVIHGLVRTLAPGLQYEARTVALREAAKASGFLPAGHAYTFSEDLVHGRLDDRRLAFCELHASTHGHDEHGGERGGTGGGFQGLFFRIGLDGAVRDHVVVLPSPARLGRAADAYGAAPPGGGRPVPFEDPVFAGAFQVFAQDPGVAKALLRPAVRERLLALAADQDVFVAWRDKDLYLGLPRRRPWLEPSTLAGAPSADQLAAFAADLAGAFEVVRALGPALDGLDGTAAPVTVDRPGPVGPG